MAATAALHSVCLMAAISLTIAGCSGGAQSTSQQSIAARVTPGSGSASQAASATTSVVTVSASSVATGGTVTLKLTAKDSSGNPFTSGGSTVTFSLNAGASVAPSAGTIGAVTDNGNGTYTATLTATQAGTAVTVAATLDGSSVLTTQPSLIVTQTGLNLEAPVEMVDFGLASSAAAPVAFLRSSTTLNTTDYDGAVYYSFEIVAQNTDSVTRYVQLVDNLGIARASIGVSPADTSPTRLRVSWSPGAAGPNTYRVQLDQTALASQLQVFAARMLVKQVGATTTKLYYPLFAQSYGATQGGDAAGFADFTSSIAYAQGTPSYYGLWHNDTSTYATLPGANGYTFEAVIASANSAATATATLYDSTAAAAVAGTSVSTSAQVPTLVDVSFNSLTNLHDFNVMIKISNASYLAYLYRAGLWLKLTGLTKAELFYRVSASMQSTATTLNPDQRLFIDSTVFNNPTYYLEATQYTASAGALALMDHGSNDSGTASVSAVAGASLALSAAPASRLRSTAFAITSGDRFIVQESGASSNVNEAFLVIPIH